MNGTASVVFHPTPSAVTVLRSHLACIVSRCRWELLLFTSVGILLQWVSYFVPVDADLPSILEGSAFGFPSGIIFLLATALWAFRIWDTFPPGERAGLTSLPVPQSTQLLLRGLAGGILWIGVLVFSFIAGRLTGVLIAAMPGLPHAAVLPMGQMLLALLALANVYLFATLLAMLFRQPSLWLLIWVPLALTALAVMLERLSSPLGTFFFTLLDGDVGLLAGFGLHTYAEGYDVIPVVRVEDPGIVLIWSMVLAAGTLVAMTTRRSR